MLVSMKLQNSCMSREESERLVGVMDGVCLPYLYGTVLSSSRGVFCPGVTDGLLLDPGWRPATGDRPRRYLGFLLGVLYNRYYDELALPSSLEEGLTRWE